MSETASPVSMRLHIEGIGREATKQSSWAPALIWPATLCIVLAGAMAWELGQAADVNDAPTINPRPLATAAPSETAPKDLATDLRENLPDMADALIARAVFEASRRPPAPVSGPLSSNVLPRLAGLMLWPSGSRAMLVQASGPAIIAIPGDRIGNYVVKSIAQGELTLLGPDGEHVLHVDFARREHETKDDVASEPPKSARPSRTSGPFIPGITPGFPVASSGWNLKAP